MLNCMHRNECLFVCLYFIQTAIAPFLLNGIFVLRKKIEFLGIPGIISVIIVQWHTFSLSSNKCVLKDNLTIAMSLKLKKIYLICYRS